MGRDRKTEKERERQTERGTESKSERLSEIKRDREKEREEEIERVRVRKIEREPWRPDRGLGRRRTCGLESIAAGKGKDLTYFPFPFAPLRPSDKLHPSVS